MRIDIISIFCEYVAPLQLSLLGKAADAGLVSITAHDLRQWTTDRHRTVDDTPYGGGAGMVMKPDVWGAAISAVRRTDATRSVLVVPTPAGHVFNQARAADLAQADQLIFACGRYEGIDERVMEWAARDMEVLPISLGDYVLNGGEVAAMAITEAVVRLIPGVVGNPASLVEESHSDGLLEYPVYTKPAQWQGLSVPEVLTSGNHAAIAEWRAQQSRDRTVQRRPDLLAPSAIGEAVFRRAQLADVPQLWSVLVGSAQEATGESVTRCVADGEVWLAVDGNRIVGACIGAQHDGVMTVALIEVVPDWQRRGLANAMLDRLSQAMTVHVRVPAQLDWVISRAKKRRMRRVSVDEHYAVYRYKAVP